MNIHFNDEVSRARAAGRPIVALESTVITHGLPYSANLETARMMENAVRESGAIPATIAIITGKIYVGLTEEQLEYLAQAKEVRKCSRRDLPIVVARGEDGATTVAGTMIVAERAGINVFATGGIGGVHRGHPFDVSADLEELGRTTICVVCAGAKAILDMPLTMEALETRGVTVVGYGVDMFPAFYSRSSGLGVDVQCDTPEEVARIFSARLDQQLQGGVLVGVPVSKEDELELQQAERAITEALAEAEAKGVSGKKVTPFLLARVSELTGWASQKANISLLQNNARIAAKIATALTHA